MPIGSSPSTAKARSGDTRRRAQASPATVVIPVYGAGPHLDRVVAALKRQTLPLGRIILSHSGQYDPTGRFAATEGVIVLHSPERLYAGAARNRGLAIAQSEWIAFVDEDVIVDENWHAAMQEAIARGEADCIVGSIGYAETGGYWGMSLWFVEFGSVHPYLPPREAFAGASANMAIRTRVIEAIGGFPEDWPRAQDTVAQIYLRRTGARIRFEPALTGNHVNLPGLKRMLRHLYVAGQYSGRVRVEFPEVPGKTAAQHPVLSLGLAPARIAQTVWRVTSAHAGPVGSLVVHLPGILLGLTAWNAGFVRAVFEPGQNRR